MSDNLRKMAEEEGLHLAERSFSANSHKALLLSEAAKEEGERIFYDLHDSIFKAYFTDGQNISDPNVLQALAGEAGVSEKTVHKAWKESRYEAALNETLELASRKGINGVPTFIIGDRVVVGAVPTTTLLDAARGVHARASQHNSVLLMG